MKLLVIADNHGDKKSLEKAKQKAKNSDIVIHVGDLTMFEQNLRQLLEELDSWNKKVLLVHGNHENEKIMRKLCEKKKNIYFIHNGFFKTGEYIFIGYGGGGFAERDSEFENRTAYFDTISKGLKLFLVLHQPPYSNVDLVGKNHTGNKSFTDYIKKSQPVMAFCGHIHDCEGKTDKIGKTLVVNSLPEGMEFEV